MGENRQTYHHSAPRPCSRVQRMDGDKPLSRGLNPGDKFSVNEELLTVNIFLGKYSLFVSLHNSHIV